MRFCIDCDEEKSVEDFPKNGKYRRTRCHPCYTAYNTERKRAGYRSDKNREASWLRKFNLTVERYNEMLDDQGGVCAICKQPETSSNRYGPKKFLAVDHDHSCCPGKFSCGKCVRGLLCHRCNVMIGFAEDDSERLKSAAVYLKSESIK